MADSKISALPASTTPLAGTEVLPIVQSSTTRQVSVANLTAGRAIGATSIQFGAGSVLSVYEEGTWTPTVGGTWTITPTIFGTSKYTKIGRSVTVTFGFQTGAKATTFAGYFDGLPFNVGATATGAVVDNNIVNRGLAEVTSTARVWVTDLSFPDVNFVTVTYFV
jgi:hypothetical protein